MKGARIGKDCTHSVPSLKFTTKLRSEPIKHSSNVSNIQKSILKPDIGYADRHINKVWMHPWWSEVGYVIAIHETHSALRLAFVSVFNLNLILGCTEKGLYCIFIVSVEELHLCNCMLACVLEF